MIRKKTMLIEVIIAIFLAIVTIAGLTYAYFSASIFGNEEASSMVVKAGELRLVFTDTFELTMNAILPGRRETKTFTVENTGTEELEYTIDIINLVNTFQNDELVYSLESDNNGATVNRKPLPTGVSEGNLAIATIEPGVTQTYTLEILFLETGSSQDYNQGASFSGKLQINSDIEYSRSFVTIKGKVTNENGSPIANATVEVHSEVRKGVTNSKGEYTIIGVEPGEHTIKVKNEEGTYIINNETIIPKAEKVGVQVIYSTTSESNINVYIIYPTLTEKMLAANKTQSDSLIDFGKVSGDDNGKGLFYTSDTSKTEDLNGDGTGEIVYYYRGVVENNYVLFDGFCWRIVRTNEDGSVKLRFGGSPADGVCSKTGTAVNIGTSPYATPDTNKNAGNYKNSNIKAVVEDWYETNIWKDGQNVLVTNLISDSPYCNDISESESGSMIYFGAHYRLGVDNSTPQYKCVNDAYAYTVEKGDLTYPIALLTADEVLYAGGRGASNYYLYTNETYWTITPKYFTGSIVYGYYIYMNGGLDINYLAAVRGVVPVISLKPEAKVFEGTGAYNNPYVIMTE